MLEERLLERIRSFSHERERRGSANQRRCIDSILAHLQRLLNTRQGNVPIAPDYGVPDFLDFLQTYPESVHKIEQSIRRAIDQYEPRLAGSSVTFLPDGEESLTLRFQITASLRSESGRKVYLETIIGTDGRVYLRH